MDVLCADKTGTLTQDKVILQKHVDVFGEESQRVLEYAYLNSFYQDGSQESTRCRGSGARRGARALKADGRLPKSMRFPSTSSGGACP